MGVYGCGWGSGWLGDVRVMECLSVVSTRDQGEMGELACKHLVKSYIHARTLNVDGVVHCC